MRIFLLSIILAATSLACAQTSAKPLSSFDQELVNQEKQFFEHLGAKDSPYVNASVSLDFKGVGTNGDFYDRSELIGIAQEGLPKDWRIYDINVVRLNDSSAVVSYNQIIPRSHPRYLHMSDTWAKENGQWKLKFQQATPNLWSAQDLD
jgi:hypothetical protein